MNVPMSAPGRLIAIASITALLTAGCSGTTAAPEEKTGSNELGSSAQQRLDELYQGVSTSPATEGPTPQPGKKIWVVANGQSSEAVAGVTKAASDAGKLIGWDVTIFDGKFQPNVQLSGVQQAVAANADGIVLTAIDCATVKSALEAAKKAGIPVVGIESQDCDPSLETVLTYSEGQTFKEWVTQLGADSAVALAANVASDATVIELKETDYQTTLWLSEGFQKSLKENCPGCRNVVVEFTGLDYGPNLQEKVQQTLLRNPDASGIFAAVDDAVTASSAPALIASGRNDSVYVVSETGNVSALDLIRQNRGLDADLVIAGGWEGYSAIDWMNRIFNGIQPTADNASTGIGYQLVDADHNLPKAGPASANVDFISIYKKTWGMD